MKVKSRVEGRWLAPDRSPSVRTFAPDATRRVSSRRLIADDVPAVIELFRMSYQRSRIRRECRSS
jgi:hypothetical protein